jgi:hypothetical protein
VLGGTLAVCFALIALNFRAAIVPLKLLLTVAMPIAFVFGLTVCVYQDGALDWLGETALGRARTPDHPPPPPPHI